MIAFLTGLFAVGYAQSPPAPAIISTNGGTAQNSMMILEWTIGEIAVESYRNGENYYTEGFHQPVLTVMPVEKNHGLVSNSEESTSTGGTVRVMPNPVSSWLNIEFDLEKEMNMHLQLFDLSGKLIENEHVIMQKGSAEMDFSTFSPGIYMLHVISEDGSFSRSCKISKN